MVGDLTTNALDLCRLQQRPSIERGEQGVGIAVQLLVLAEQGEDLWFL